MRGSDDVLATQALVDYSGPDGDGISELSLVRTRKANAMSADLCEAITTHLGHAEADGTRALLITSAGRAFCAGFDFSDLESQSSGDILVRLVRVEEMLQRVHGAPFPVAACVQGPAVGAGADLAVACHLRIGTNASEFRFPGAQFGVVLGTRRLASLVGGGNARSMVLAGGRVGADEAVTTSLLTEVAPSEGLRSAARARLLQHLRATATATPSLLAATETRDYDADLAALVRSVTTSPPIKDRIRQYLGRR